MARILILYGVILKQRVLILHGVILKRRIVILHVILKQSGGNLDLANALRASAFYFPYSLSDFKNRENNQYFTTLLGDIIY